jgi:hypothetical protein
MKQFSLLLILCCLLMGFARAATISGVVANATTGCPIVGQKVFVSDSLGLVRDSTVTTITGTYFFSIPASVPAGDHIDVYVTACGVLKLNTVIWSGSNAASNFNVCPGTYNFHGIISLGSTANNGLARVYLIRKDYDTALADTVLTVVDSITTASNGGAYSKNYTIPPSGTILLKAALLPSHPNYLNFLPTYDSSVLVWSIARPLSTAYLNGCATANINMVAGSNPGGTGFIGGRVLVGANKSAGVGDPIPNMILLLTDINNKAIAYRYSTANGQFSFSNLAFGTYKIFGDVWGKTNPAFTVTITAAQPSIGNIIFEDDSATFKAHINILSSVTNTSALKDVTVYPNPVTDHVAFTGIDKISGQVTVVLSNIIGSTLLRQSFDAGSKPRISTADLPAGTYIIQLHTDEGTASFRIVK